jgi:hypothetical protein
LAHAGRSLPIDHSTGRPFGTDSIVLRLTRARTPSPLPPGAAATPATDLELDVLPQDGEVELERLERLGAHLVAIAEHAQGQPLPGLLLG